MSTPPKIQLYGQLITELEREVHALIGRAVSAEKAAQLYLNGRDRLLEDLADQTAENDKLHGQLSGALELRDTLTAANVELQAECDRLVRRNEQLVSENAELQNAYSEESTQLRYAQNRLGELQLDFDRAASKIDEINGQLSAETERANKLARQLKKMDEARAAEAKSADAATLALADRDNEIERLKKDIARLATVDRPDAPKPSKNNNIPTPPDGYVILTGRRRNTKIADDFLAYNARSGKFEPVRENHIGKTVAKAGVSGNCFARPVVITPSTNGSAAQKSSPAPKPSNNAIVITTHVDEPPELPDGYVSVSGGAPLQAGDLVASLGAKTWSEPNKIAIGRTPIKSYFAVCRPINGEPK